MPHILDFELIRSHRSSLSLQINLHGKLVVKAPHLMPMFLINRFVNEKSEWIDKHLKGVQKSYVNRLEEMQEGNEFLYLGNLYKLEIGNYKEVTVGDKLYFPKFLSFRLKKEVTEWYIRQAKKIITQRVIYYSAIMKKNYKSIIYSDTTSKWGSCSVDNRLQFNWRLIMSSILVLDYVVVHELVHTTEKNHRRKFWKEVEKYKPAYKQYIKWLKENSYRLHSI
ncbi:hypothetical protein A3D77_06540 [Candidatus Gottesmanbacteria bacterium RIFCSPHIGHO2_02_FULL_39_11]|uniref:YgjP-like metallopeptidase domain-containing protein n=1 Tax=Candidatus Gottesmanbacteria bacterium RIFCSPHIGHO2_02_FULL_39_11 TaxID=1798382 RepID=A0A1F5ZSP7_9BACT|nr:MAG: hypothetical protein A3D77_06540 [Candidatus Gottesmanbacteria bacterium RIFCSPHIGHO2_02_FULL_39_11]